MVRATFAELGSARQLGDGAAYSLGFGERVDIGQKWAYSFKL